MAVKAKIDTGYERSIRDIIESGKAKFENAQSGGMTLPDKLQTNHDRVDKDDIFTNNTGYDGSYSGASASGGSSPAKSTGVSTSADHIAQAQAVLNNRQYQSNWQNQIDEYLGKIQNRDPFSYDLNADALYRQYAEDYIRQGKMAMMDTMGQAAALTGGYGNSYAQNVGQQAYNQQVSQIQNIVPDLYNMALNRYIAEGDQMRNNLSMLQQQENQDYGRFYDRLAEQDNAYNKLINMMTNFGYVPTKEELAYAGMTETEMKKIMEKA